MSKYQNSNVAFRCPASLKAKMKAFAEANDQHLSGFIRFACSEVLRREIGGYTSNIPTEVEIKHRLEELV
jgi:hypothetical protein